MVTQTATLIIGASSQIAKSLAEQAVLKGQSQLVVVSRDLVFYQQSQFKNVHAIKVENYQEETMVKVVNEIKERLECHITQVFICHGLLHHEQLSPEKRLADLTETNFLEVMKANTITPILWLKHLTSVLKSKTECKVVIFTARVGSISDNEIGGWYSYRTSKAAMNMLIKSAAVEFKRTAKNIKLISFHPGTTDTPLSKPFQKNVPKNKLFNSTFVALQLFDIVEKTPVDGTASFLDWQGKSIAW